MQNESHVLTAACYQHAVAMTANKLSLAEPMQSGFRCPMCHAWASQVICQ